MFTKLLLTLLVIAGAFITLRLRAQRRLNPAPAQERLINPANASKPQQKLWLILAGGLVLIALSGAAFYLYLQWSDHYREVTVVVIDSRSGKQTSYRALKGDIEGRSFVTLDGRQVTLAQSERMETSR